MKLGQEKEIGLPMEPRVPILELRKDPFGKLQVRHASKITLFPFARHPQKRVPQATPPPDQEEGRRLVRQAIEKARKEGRLIEAADMMEEAFNKSPELRGKYESQVKLWRCGISM